MAQKVKFNLDEITLGDIELFEEATGMDLLTVLQPRPVTDPVTGRPIPDPNDSKGRPLMEVRPSGRALVGLMYLALRKENPGTTMDDVRKTRLTDLQLEFEETEAENPTAATPETKRGGGRRSKSADEYERIASTNGAS